MISFKNIFRNSTAIFSFFTIYLCLYSQLLASAQKDETTLNIVIGRCETTRHPFAKKNLSNSAASFFLHLHSLPLFTLNEKNQWACLLCRKFPQIQDRSLEKITGKNKSKFLKMHLELDPSYKWGDGENITGKDLVFTWEISKNITHNFIGKSFFRNIDQIILDPKNARNLTIFFKSEKYFYADWGEIHLIPQHLEQEIWTKAKKDFKKYMQDSLYLNNPSHPGLYSGAYLYSEISKKYGFLSMKQNPYYFSKFHLFKRLKILMPEQVSTKHMNNNQSLIISETLHENEHDLNKVKSWIYRNKDLIKQFNLREIWGDSIVFEHIALNHRNPILKDKRIRKALAYAVDKNFIIDGMYQDELLPAASFLHPTNPNFSPLVTMYDFNLEKSRKILDSAEWILDENTQIRYKSGIPLNLNITTNKISHRKILVKNLIKNWQAIGFRVSVKFQGDPDFFQKTLTKIKFSGATLFSWKIPTDASLYSIFHSKSIPNIYNHYEGQNISAWINGKIDQSISKLETEFQQEKRKRLYSQIQKIYSDELPSIPLFFRFKKAYASPLVHHYKIPSNQFPSSLLTKNFERIFDNISRKKERSKSEFF
mgnify:CR=1 FL=1